MKKGIHPTYNSITIVRTDGSRIPSHMCWGKEGQDYICDVDPLTHQAWVGGNTLRKTGQMEKFGNKFGGVDFGSLSKKASA
jgi:large subunit ribosomal protein L31